MTYAETLLVVVSLALVLLLIVVAKHVLPWWEQLMINRKRERAHAGKVKCEETTERCDRVATVLTHNGYYCFEHWEPNSKYLVNGGFVTWHHQLYHAFKDH